MTKKNFKGINPAMQFITHPEQETQEEQDEQKTQLTQGRKGQKLQRINMAFQPENLDYLQTISRIEGVSMTDYVNRILQKDRITRADIVEKAKALLKEAGR